MVEGDAVTGAVLVVSSLALAVVWIVLEVVTLRNDVPGDHITAVVRRAVRAQPGPFIWLAFTLGYLAGHLTWW